MVNQISVPRAKYELLTDVRQPHWKRQLLCCCLFLSLLSLLVVVRVWSGGAFWWKERRALKENTEEEEKDAEGSAWLRRAWMYAESTKENQNADRNASLSTAQLAGTDSSSREQMVVCYYTVPGNLNTQSELSPSHLDPDLCTHIIVGFARVVNCTLVLPADAPFFWDVLALRKIRPSLKVMVSAAGSSELHYGFSLMVKNHANRKKFIRSVLNATRIYGLDGLDVDWEFPGWLGADEGEKVRFCQLLEELRKEFDRSGQKLILSVAVAAPRAIVEQSYEVPQMAQHVDFVNLMSYDFHSYVWYYPETGLNAPLYSRSTESGYLSTLNVRSSAEFWMSKGMPREKLIIGIPTYGHSFRLDNRLNHGVQAPSSGFGKLGVKGFVNYPTVCHFLSIGGKRVFEEESKVPYAYKDFEWISFDDEESIRYKALWIRDNRFGGAMVLSLNADDWNKSCGFNGTSFPLTRILSSIILNL